MHTEVLIVAAPDRLPRIQCRGGLTARSTLADTVHLVSSAATPLGGDSIAIRVVVEPGGRLRLRSVAATVALPGAATRRSYAEMTLEVAGSLDVDLEPTVVAADAEHISAVHARLDTSGELRLRERVQIGRTGEGQGFWSGSMHADAQGRPLLRHRMELGAGSLADDAIDTPRACASTLQWPGSAVSEPGTLLTLAGGGALTTWQGPRLPADQARLALSCRV
ncbi:MAG TPA: urease accessory protein UreD [Mycobacterium sp.]|nr:urease accessory protein UreD [Mycobacterium sp.]